MYLPQACTPLNILPTAFSVNVSMRSLTLSIYLRVASGSKYEEKISTFFFVCVCARARHVCM